MSSQISVLAGDQNRARFLDVAKKIGAGDSAGKPPKISPASVYHSHSHDSRPRRGGPARSSLRVGTVDGSAMLTNTGRLAPPPIGVRPKEEYYRNENNHPDILSTILETCRVNAGYSPAEAGAGDTPELAKKQHAAFLSFLHELDKYYDFLTLERMETKQVKNTSLDCEGLANAVATVVGEDLEGEAESLKKRIINAIKAAAKRVTKNVTTNSVVNAAFNNVNLPAPSDSQSNRDPKTMLCFSIVGMSRVVESGGYWKGRTDSSSEFLNITTATYRLRSASVSAYAFYLAGSTIIPAELTVKNFQTVAT